jgi:hypothetical protein
MWRVYGEQIFTADVAGSTPVHFQKFKLPSDFVIACIRARIEIFNNPSFSTAQMRIYSNRGNNPISLLFTSLAVPKESIHSLNYARKEVPFIFNPKPMLKGGDHYHAVLWLNNYTGNENSHVAWIRGFPDPINPTNYTTTGEKIAVAPFEIALFGGAP